MRGELGLLREEERREMGRQHEASVNNWRICANNHIGNNK